MAADEEKDQIEQEKPSGISDSERTVAMSSDAEGKEPKKAPAKPQKKQDDWITVQGPSAPKAADVVKAKAGDEVPETKAEVEKAKETAAKAKAAAEKAVEEVPETKAEVEKAKEAFGKAAKVEAAKEEGVEGGVKEMPEAQAAGGWSEAGEGAAAKADRVLGTDEAPPSFGGAAAPAGGGIWGLLSSIGIKERKTQQWVLYGCGGLLLLSCLCSCAAIVIAAASGAFGG